MKFLTFVDLHEDKKILKKLISRAKKDDIDFIVVAGDLSTFERSLGYLMQELNKIGKKILVIHGNHEAEEEMEKKAKEFKNFVFFHKKAVEIEDFVFLGYGGGGFSQSDPEFRGVARGWYGKYQDKKIILVTHGPPFGVSADKINEDHVGNKDFRKFIERIVPRLVVCGHIHETAGAVDEIGITKVINPGWEGMTIEL